MNKYIKKNCDTFLKSASPWSKPRKEERNIESFRRSIII